MTVPVEKPAASRFDPPGKSATLLLLMDGAGLPLIPTRTFDRPFLTQPRGSP